MLKITGLFNLSILIAIKIDINEFIGGNDKGKSLRPNLSKFQKFKNLKKLFKSN